MRENLEIACSFAAIYVMLYLQYMLFSQQLTSNVITFMCCGFGLIMLFNVFIPEVKPSDWLLLLLQCRVKFSGKGITNQFGESLACQNCVSVDVILLTPTSPSLDSSLSSVLQVASRLPASAFISTPLGASITRDRVGDSNLKYIQD